MDAQRLGGLAAAERPLTTHAPGLELTLDALDAERIADFWAAALGYERRYVREPYIVLGPPAGDPRPRLNVQRVASKEAGKAPLHLDLFAGDVAVERERLVALGASVTGELDERDVGGSAWFVLADPEGTPFCLVPERQLTDGPFPVDLHASAGRVDRRTDGSQVGRTPVQDDD